MAFSLGESLNTARGGVRGERPRLQSELCVLINQLSGLSFMLAKFSTAVFVAATACVSFVHAQQSAPKSSWPQWGGHNRDHKSLETGLKQEWPEAGPAVAWKFTDAGLGYSSLAVVNGKGYTLGTIDGKNVAICINASTGELVWKTPIADAVPSNDYLQGWGGGPRSTPTVVGDRIVVLDDGGTLASLEAATGRVQWQVNIKSEFGGQLPKWGYSDSPLVDGDRVVVCPGGKEFLVALNLETGKKIFGSSGFEAAPHYVSVMKHSVRGIDSYISAADRGMVAFSAKDGSFMWRNDSSGNGTATIPTPIIDGNFVYHTSDYGTGCVLVEVTAANGKLTAKEVYANKNMQNHHGGVVLHNDCIFGLKKGGGFVCQDFRSGEVKWTERLSGDGSASIAFADGRLYVYGEGTGTCYLIEPSKEKWTIRGKLNLPEQTKIERQQGKIWAHPVIAEGKLYLRDLDLIYAFDIKK